MQLLLFIRAKFKPLVALTASTGSVVVRDGVFKPAVAHSISRDGTGAVCGISGTVAGELKVAALSSAIDVEITPSWTGFSRCRGKEHSDGNSKQHREERGPQ